MPGPEPALTPSARAALERLADIVAPTPVSLVPRSWGWAIVAGFALAGLAWAYLRHRRHRRANRYRAEALAELTRIERFITDGGAVAQAMASMTALLKRVALAAWPRSRVASLAQGRWTEFLHATDGEAGRSAPLARWLDDAEYRAPDGPDAPSATEAIICARDARRWIEAHRVSA